MRKHILFSILSMACIATAFSQSDKELVEQTVNRSTIEGHIYFLADDLLKGRETGTPENKIAASYLANTLRSYGVKPNPATGTYYQEVELQKTTPPSRVVMKMGDKEVKNKLVMDAFKFNYKGAGLYVGYGMEDDYKGKNVNGKIVLMRGGSAEAGDMRSAYRMRRQKEELAKSKGAVAVVELIQADASMWGFLEHNFNSDRLEVRSDNKEEMMAKKGSDFAYLWVQDEYGTQGVDLEGQPSQNVELQISGKAILPVSSNNVIGVVEGTDPELKNEYIIYSAHYDHVGIGQPDETGDEIYNGARDNAVGTTTVLSMAQHLAKHPTKRSALFILFTGEEKGLLGSQYYVEHPVLPLEQMVYCFNSDNGGYNDTSLATIIGLPRTTAQQHISDAVAAFGLTAIDDPAPEQGLFDRSDNVNFAAKGIPAPTFSMGFRSFDGEVTKYYHQPGDEADTMDYDYLEKFFRAYVLAGVKIGNDPQTPFWVSGDKYEQAGKELYGMKGVKN